MRAGQPITMCTWGLAGTRRGVMDGLLGTVLEAGREKSLNHGFSLAEEGASKNFRSNVVQL